MYNRRRFLQGTGAALAVGLAGCAGDSTDGTEDGGTQQTDRRPTEGSGEPFSTQVAATHWPINPSSPPLAVAQSSGYYADHGVEVEEIVSFAGGGTTVRGVVTGGIGIGVTALNAVIKSYLAGAPLYIVGVSASQPSIDWEVLPDSDIESIQDVAGKTIALSNPGSTSEAEAIMNLRNAEGISPDDVDFMYTGGLGESITAVTQGNADVTWNAPPLTQDVLAKGTLRRAWHSRDHLPVFTEAVFVAGDRVLDEEPELVEGVIGATLDAVEFIKGDIPGTAEIWAEASDLPAKALEAALEDFNATGGYYDIEPREETLKTVVEAMQIMGELDQDVPWGEIIVQDPLPEDRRVDWV